MKKEAIVTSKGQITIPQEVRLRLGLAKGDRVAFVVEDGMTIMKPVRGDENPFVRYVGALGAFETKGEVHAWLSELRDEKDDR